MSINHEFLEVSLIQIEEMQTKEWDIALNTLYHFREIEIDELQKVINTIIRNITEGNYHLSQYPSIFHSMSFINDNKYIEFDFDDFKKKYFSSIDKIKSDPAKIPTSLDFLSFNNSDFSKNLELQSIIEKIRCIMKDNEKNVQNKSMVHFFEMLNNSSVNDFVETYHDVKHMHLFENINSNNFTVKILSLKNIGIHRLSRILHDLFLSVSNAGSVYYSEKDHLLQISDFIKTELAKNNIDQMKKNLLLNLSNEFKKSASHLENTK